ncbi:hypothetical protein [Micromonospora arborensis]|uniref:hypothetical protein n=1 Tax=Micromonospora arborensis TaxID=2116518 RepID=UPI00371A8C7A
MSDTITLVRHPHTGLRTPDARFKVSSLRQHETRDGVAFTASLKDGNRIVGTIENSGSGGPTDYWCKFERTHPLHVSPRQLEEYAALCRNERGEPVGIENLLEDLITEFETAKRIAAVEKRNSALLRTLGFIPGDDDKPTGEPDAQDEVTWGMPAERLNLEEAAETLNRRRPAGDNAWWQVWRDGKWVDVTKRPEVIPADLYC